MKGNWKGLATLSIGVVLGTMVEDASNQLGIMVGFTAAAATVLSIYMIDRKPQKNQSRK